MSNRGMPPHRNTLTESPIFAINPLGTIWPPSCTTFMPPPPSRTYLKSFLSATTSSLSRQTSCKNHPYPKQLGPTRFHSQFAQSPPHPLLSPAPLHLRLLLIHALGQHHLQVHLSPPPITPCPIGRPSIPLSLPPAMAPTLRSPLAIHNALNDTPVHLCNSIYNTPRPAPPTTTIYGSCSTTNITSTTPTSPSPPNSTTGPHTTPHWTPSKPHATSKTASPSNHLLPS